MRWGIAQGLAASRIAESKDHYITVDLDSETGYSGKFGAVKMADKVPDIVSDEEVEEEDPGDNWDDDTAWMLTPRRRAMWEAQKNTETLAQEAEAAEAAEELEEVEELKLTEVAIREAEKAEQEAKRAEQEAKRAEQEAERER